MSPSLCTNMGGEDAEPLHVLIPVHPPSLLLSPSLPSPPSPFSYLSFCHQDTSVVSPIITPVILAPMVFIYAYMSPGHMIEGHLMLFLCALTLPIVKTTILMMVSHRAGEEDVPRESSSKRVDVVRWPAGRLVWWLSSVMIVGSYIKRTRVSIMYVEIW